jgi:hypothetical protein
MARFIEFCSALLELFGLVLLAVVAIARSIAGSGWASRTAAWGEWADNLVTSSGLVNILNYLLLRPVSLLLTPRRPPSFCRCPPGACTNRLCILSEKYVFAQTLVRNRDIALLFFVVLPFIRSFSFLKIDP